MLKRVLTTIAIATSFAITSSAAWSQAQPKDIKWATSAVGSSGHKALVVLANLLNKEMPNYRISVLPTPGAIVTVKGFCTGQFDGFYGSDIAYHELVNDSARFKGFKANMKRQPIQSFWTFTTDVSFAIHSRNKDKIKKWGDLEGKRIYTGPLPWDVRAHLERGLAALGVKFNYHQIDLATAGSHLEKGTIDAMLLYTSGGSPPPWLTEASLSVDWAALNPSPEEIATLKKKGLSAVEIDPTVFKRDVHVKKVTELPFYYGFNVGLEVPADDVYKMLNVIEKNAADLAKTDPSFSEIARDMKGFQKRGVESAWELVPIHPGLAKWMREKGVWDKKWDSKVAAM
jgi:TRAP transporter TAXI family solute receptor